MGGAAPMVRWPFGALLLLLQLAATRGVSGTGYVERPWRVGARLFGRDVDTGVITSCALACGADAADERCPCNIDACRSVETPLGGVYEEQSVQCRRAVREHCCALAAGGGMPGECAPFARVVECVPWPAEPVGFRGFKGTARTSRGLGVVYPTDGVDYAGLSAQDYVLGPPDITPVAGKPNPQCAVYPQSWWGVASVPDQQGWVPAVYDYPRGARNGSYAVIGLTAPLIEVSSVKIYGVPPMDGVASVTLLGAPMVDYAMQEPGGDPTAEYIDRRYHKEVKVYESQDPRNEVPPAQAVDADGEPAAPPHIGYHGTKATTRSGKQCLNWGHNLYPHPFDPRPKDALPPHLRLNVIQNAEDGPGKLGAQFHYERGNGVGDHNYCRNPDGDPQGAWCYVWDDSLGMPPMHPASPYYQGPPFLQTPPPSGSPAVGAKSRYGYSEVPINSVRDIPGYAADPIIAPSDSAAGYSSDSAAGYSGYVGSDYSGYVGSGYSSDVAYGSPDPNTPPKSQPGAAPTPAPSRTPTFGGLATSRTHSTLQAPPAPCRGNDVTGLAQLLQVPIADADCDMEALRARVRGMLVGPRANVELDGLVCGEYGAVCCATCAGYGDYRAPPREAREHLFHQEPRTAPRVRWQPTYAHFDATRFMLGMDGQPYDTAGAGSGTYDYSSGGAVDEQRYNEYAEAAAARAWFPVLDMGPLKEYCELPQPKPCRDGPLEVDLSTLATPLPTKVTAVKIRMKTAPNYMPMIDAVEVTGLEASDCTASAEGGYWQEPLCLSCAVSALAVYKGPDCKSLTCEGTPCMYGYCVDGPAGPGTACQCFAGYAGDDCAVQCPVDLSGMRHYPVNPSNGVVERPDLFGSLYAEMICSGKGVCNDGVAGDGRCTCREGFGGDNCELRCPGTEGPDFEPCSGHGTCDAATLTCTCEGEFFGDGCELRLCNGARCYHGECLNRATELPCDFEGDAIGCYCACHGLDSFAGAAPYGRDAAGTRGYWWGDECNECQSTYVGDACATPNYQTHRYTLPDTPGVNQTLGPYSSPPCIPLQLDFEDPPDNLVTKAGKVIQSGNYIAVDVGPACGAAIGARWTDILPAVGSDPVSVKFTYEMRQDFAPVAIVSYVSTCPNVCGHGYCKKGAPACPEDVTSRRAQVLSAPHRTRRLGFRQAVLQAQQNASVMAAHPHGDLLRQYLAARRDGRGAHSLEDTTSTAELSIGAPFDPETYTATPLPEDSSMLVMGSYTQTEIQVTVDVSSLSDGEYIMVDPVYNASDLVAQIEAFRHIRITPPRRVYSLPKRGGTTRMQARFTLSIVGLPDADVIRQYRLDFKAWVVVPFGRSGLDTKTPAREGFAAPQFIARSKSHVSTIPHYVTVYTPDSVPERRARAVRGDANLEDMTADAATPGWVSLMLKARPSEGGVVTVGTGEYSPSKNPLDSTFFWDVDWSLMEVRRADGGGYEDTRQPAAFIESPVHGVLARTDGPAEALQLDVVMAPPRTPYVAYTEMYARVELSATLITPDGTQSWTLKDTDATRTKIVGVLLYDPDVPLAQEGPTSLVEGEATTVRVRPLIPEAVRLGTRVPLTLDVSAAFTGAGTLPSGTPSYSVTPATITIGPDDYATPVDITVLVRNDDAVAQSATHLTVIVTPNLEGQAGVPAAKTYPVDDIHQRCGMRVTAARPQCGTPAAPDADGVCECSSTSVCDLETGTCREMCGVQTNRSVCGDGATYTPATQTCECSGADAVCLLGVCRTACNRFRQNAAAPKCPQGSRDIRVVGRCECRTSSCQASGACVGDYGWCDGSPGVLGCPKGAREANGVCVCTVGTCGADGRCTLGCGMTRADDSQPPCNSGAAVTYPVNGLCVCKGHSVCTAGACIAQAPAVQPTVFEPQPTSRCGQPKEVMAATAIGPYELPPPVPFNGTANSAQAEAKRVSAPFEYGTEHRYAQMTSGTTGCMDSIRTLVYVNCPMPRGRVARNGLACEAAQDLTDTVVLLHSVPCAQATGGTVIGRAEPWQQTSVEVAASLENRTNVVPGLKRGPPGSDMLRWVTYDFIYKPQIEAGVEYCVEMQHYKSATKFEWLVKDRKRSPEVTTDHRLKVYDATKLEAERLEEDLMYAAAVVVRPTAVVDPVDDARAANCEVGVQCARNRGMADHGFMPTIDACAERARAVDAQHYEYSITERVCRTFTLCRTTKARAQPSVVDGSQTAPFNLSGVTYVCTHDASEACVVGGLCTWGGEETEWSVQRRRCGDGCRLCFLPAADGSHTGGCQACAAGWHLHLPAAGTRPCAGTCMRDPPASTDGTCTPPCTCRGETGHGECDSRPAGGTQCHPTAVFAPSQALCRCAAGMYCYKDDNPAMCLDPIANDLATGWCGQRPRADGTCLNSTMAVRVGKCECGPEEVCGLADGYCRSEVSQCGDYVGTSTSVCRYGSALDAVTRMCVCPAGSKCTLDTATSRRVCEAVSVSGGACGGCNARPCYSGRGANIEYVCQGPTSIINMSPATGSCECEAAAGYTCCSEAVAAGVNAAYPPDRPGCTPSLYGRCVKKVDESDRGECNMPPKAAGCALGTTPITFTSATAGVVSACRCNPGTSCYPLEIYRTCITAPGVAPAGCGEQDAGAGCVMGAFVNDNNLCECHAADGYYCSEQATCRQRDTTCPYDPFDSKTLEVLDNKGSCVCDGDDVNGYWSGPSCSECLTPYFGPTCTFRCDLQRLPGLDHLPGWMSGTYDNAYTQYYEEGSCACPTSAVVNGQTVALGFSGPLCTECPAVGGQYGDTCSVKAEVTSMIWSWDLNEDEPVLQGPYGVLSYSPVSVELFDMGAFEEITDAVVSVEMLFWSRWESFFADRDVALRAGDLTTLKCTAWTVSSRGRARCSVAAPRGAAFMMYRVTAGHAFAERETKNAITRFASDCCNGHGYCSPEVTTCECALNELVGFWAEGTDCLTCAVGFSGPMCNDFSAKFTARMTAAVDTAIPAAVAGATDYYAIDVQPRTPYRAKLEGGEGNCDLKATLRNPCEDGWSFYDGACYKVLTEECHTQRSAQDACRASGGSMAQFRVSSSYLHFMARLLDDPALNTATSALPCKGNVWTDVRRDSEPYCWHTNLGTASDIDEAACTARGDSCRWIPPDMTAANMYGKCVRSHNMSCIHDRLAGASATPPHNDHSEATCAGVAGGGRCRWNKLAYLECPLRDFGGNELGASVCGYDGPLGQPAGLRRHTRPAGVATEWFDTDASVTFDPQEAQQTRTPAGKGACEREWGWDRAGSGNTEPLADAGRLAERIAIGSVLNQSFCDDVLMHAFNGWEKWVDVCDYHDTSVYYYWRWDTPSQDPPQGDGSRARGVLERNCMFIRSASFEGSTFSDRVAGIPAYCDYETEYGDYFVPPYADDTINLVTDGLAVCQKQRPTATSQMDAAAAEKILPVTADKGLLAQQLGTPRCYEPDTYLTTADECDTLFVPDGHELLAMSVTCLTEGATYNLSVSYISDGHYEGDGEWPCVNDAIRGHWKGDFCTQCMPRWTGAACKTFVSCADDATPCARGTCNATTGFCECEAGYYGLYCDTFCDNSTCNARGNGGVCNDMYQLCPEPPGTPSRCATQTDLCTCPERWAGANCTTCADGYYGYSCTHTCNCNGQICDPKDGTCTCFANDVTGHWTGFDCSTCAINYYGTDCTRFCSRDETCTGNGECSDVGECNCDAKHYGVACDVFCNDCSGNGRCAADGTCVCNADYTRGFWDGADCSVCKTSHYGAQCNSDCSCSLNGVCTVDGTCVCYADEVNGHWTGAQCSDCADGWSGDKCNLQASSRLTRISAFKEFQLPERYREEGLPSDLGGSSVIFNSTNYVNVLAGVGKQLGLYRRPRESPRATDMQFAGACFMDRVSSNAQKIVGLEVHKGRAYFGVQGSSESGIYILNLASEKITDQNLCKWVAYSETTTALASGGAAKLLHMFLDKHTENMYVVVHVVLAGGATQFKMGKIPLDRREFILGVGGRLGRTVSLPSFANIAGVAFVDDDPAATAAVVHGTDSEGGPIFARVFLALSNGAVLAMPGVTPADALELLAPRVADVWDVSRVPACGVFVCKKFTRVAALRGWMYMVVEVARPDAPAQATGAIFMRTLISEMSLRGREARWTHAVLPEEWDPASGVGETGAGFILFDTDTAMNDTVAASMVPMPLANLSTAYSACEGKACGDPCSVCDTAGRATDGRNPCVTSTQETFCQRNGLCYPMRPKVCNRGQPTYVYVAVRTKTPGVIYKYYVNEVTNELVLQKPTLPFVYDKREANRYSTPVAAVLDPILRVVYVTIKAPLLRMEMLNAYDVEAITPSVVDGSGGTLVTLVGEGFPTFSGVQGTLPQTTCMWGELPYFTNKQTASLIDTQTAVCRAPRATSFDSCTDSFLEVSVEDNERYTRNSRVLRQLAPAMITLVNPNSAVLDSKEPVKVEGYGFLNTSYVACLINGVVTQASYVSYTQMRCAHPYSETPVTTTVEVSLDGQVFSNAGVSYLIVGAPTQLGFTIGGSEELGQGVQYNMRSQGRNTLDDIEVFFKDYAGNKIGVQDQQVRDNNLTLHMVGPPAHKQDCQSGVQGQCGVLHGVKALPVTAGRAVFKNLFLEKPAQGEYTLFVTVMDLNRTGCGYSDLATYLPDEDSPCRVSVTTLKGEEVALATLRIDFVVKSSAEILMMSIAPPTFSTNREPLTIQPELVFRDHSGNVAEQYIGKINVRLDPPAAVGLTGDRSTVDYEKGRIRFNDLRIQADEGYVYRLHFEPVDTAIAPVVSEPIAIAAECIGNSPIHAIHPSSGLLGGQLVTIKGWGYRAESASSIRCRFGDDAPIPAMFVDTCTVLCPLQAKLAPRTAPLMVMQTADQAFEDLGFNYSYIDVADEITWAVGETNLPVERGYRVEGSILLKPIVVTLRDSAGNPLQHHDTVEGGRDVYLLSHLNLVSEDPEGFKRRFVNGTVTFDGLRVAAPVVGEYILRFTTNQYASVAEVPKLVSRETFKRKKDDDEDLFDANAHFVTYEDMGFLGTSISVQTALNVTLPEGAYWQVEPNQETLYDPYVQFPLDGVDSLGLRAADVPQCAELCQQLGSACIAFTAAINEHTCMMYAEITGHTTTSTKASGVARWVNETQMTNASAADVSGQNPCEAEVCEQVADPVSGNVTEVCTFRYSENRRLSFAKMYLGEFAAAFFVDGAGVENTTNTSEGGESEGAAANRTLGIPVVQMTEEQREKILADAAALFLRDPPDDVCIVGYRDVPFCIDSSNPRPATYLFQTDLTITITQGAAASMRFLPHSLAGVVKTHYYSRGTTNRRMLDLQPLVLVVDVGGNEVTEASGTISADVIPWCKRGERQSLDFFRYPEAYGATTSCLPENTFNASDLVGGVQQYGRTYGPSCHGSAPLGEEEKFEAECDRVRGNSAFVVNGIARFTELHFRGCASDIDGLPCTEDIRYKMVFTFVQAEDAAVLPLYSEEMYVINCPKTSALMASIEPDWMNLEQGQRVTIRGWDFQPTRDLAVSLGGVSLRPEFVDTCNTIVTLTGSRAVDAANDTLLIGGNTSDPQRRRAARVLQAGNSFDRAASTELKMVDTTTAADTEYAADFQIKSATVAGVGLELNAPEDSTASDAVTCPGEAAVPAGLEGVPRRCFYTAPTVKIGAIPIALEDEAGGKLWAVGDSSFGRNEGFYFNVQDPEDPLGPTVWGPQYPNSLAGVSDLRVSLSVEIDGVAKPINVPGAVINMTESNARGDTVSGLLVIRDAEMALPYEGDYVIRFTPEAVDGSGLALRAGAIRISVLKNRPVLFTLANGDELPQYVEDSDGMAPPPRFELLDVAANALNNEDLPSADKSLAVVAKFRAVGFLRHPHANWTGWRDGERRTLHDEAGGVVYLDDIENQARWTGRVDDAGVVDPIGLPKDRYPPFTFHELELGGDTLNAMGNRSYTTDEGFFRVTNVFHSGVSPSTASTPITTGAVFRNLKPSGMWHGVVYELRYTLSMSKYSSLGSHSHTIQRTRCPEGFFSLNFSKLCHPCPNGADCSSRDVFITAQPGFWRLSENDVAMYECPHQEACLGGYWAGDESCDEGTEGPLCSICSDGYGREYGACRKCPSLAANIVICLLYFALLVLIIFFMSKSSLSSGKRSKSVLSILLRLFVNYCHTAILLTAFLLRSDETVLKLKQAFERLSGPSTTFISFDCLTGLTVYDKFLLWSITPVVFVLVPGFVSRTAVMLEQRKRRELVNLFTSQRERRHSIGMDAAEQDDALAKIQAMEMGMHINDVAAMRKAVGLPATRAKSPEGSGGRGDGSSDDRSMASALDEKMLKDYDKVHGEGLDVAQGLEALMASPTAKGAEREARRAVLAEELALLSSSAVKDIQVIIDLLKNESHMRRSEGYSLLSQLRKDTEDKLILDKQLELVQTAVDLDPVEVWVEKTSVSFGRRYWRSRITGESVWDMPKVLVERLVEAAPKSPLSGNGDVETGAKALSEEGSDTSFGEERLLAEAKEIAVLFSNKNTMQVGRDVLQEHAALSKTPAAINAHRIRVNMLMQTLGLTAQEVWLERESKTHGRPYWRNRLTGESSWAQPDGWVRPEPVPAAPEAAAEAPQPVDLDWRPSTMVHADSSDEGPDAKAKLYMETARAVRPDDNQIDAAEGITQERVVARNRWARVRQALASTAIDKRETAYRFKATIKQRHANQLEWCMLCNSDFPVYMCRPCGVNAEREWKTDMSTIYDELCLTKEPVRRRPFVMVGDFPYMYLCRACDHVMHSKQGRECQHTRLRVKPALSKEDTTQLQPELLAYHKAKNRPDPFMVYLCVVLVALFTAFPTMIEGIGLMSQCTYIAAADTSYVRADLRVECDEAFEPKRKAALGMFFIYGAGLPLLAFLVLRAAAGPARVGLFQRRVMQSLGFLYSGYRLSCYFWEPLILLRKFFVVIILVFFNGRQQYQTMLGFYVVMLYLFMNILAKPFMHQILWTVENISLGAVALSLNLSLLFEPRFNISPGGSVEAAIMLVITLANVFVCAVYLYCVVRVMKIDMANKVEDPYDPQARSVTWRGVFHYLHCRFYKVFNPCFSRLGCAMKDPERRRNVEEVYRTGGSVSGGSEEELQRRDGGGEMDTVMPGSPLARRGGGDASAVKSD